MPRRSQERKRAREGLQLGRIAVLPIADLNFITQQYFAAGGGYPLSALLEAPSGALGGGFLPSQIEVGRGLLVSADNSNVPRVRGPLKTVMNSPCTVVVEWEAYDIVGGVALTYFNGTSLKSKVSIIETLEGAVNTFSAFNAAGASLGTATSPTQRQWAGTNKIAVNLGGAESAVSENGSAVRNSVNHSAFMPQTFTDIQPFGTMLAPDAPLEGFIRRLTVYPLDEDETILALYSSIARIPPEVTGVELIGTTSISASLKMPQIWGASGYEYWAIPYSVPEDIDTSVMNSVWLPLSASGVVEGLSPSTKYAIYIRAVNMFGPGPAIRVYPDPVTVGGDFVGALAAQEVGQDTASILISVPALPVTGQLVATEVGNDIVGIGGVIGTMVVTGSLAAQEPTKDTANIVVLIEAPAVSGVLSATEVGADRANIGGSTGGTSVAGRVSAVEAGADVASILGSVVEPPITGVLAGYEGRVWEGNEIWVGTELWNISDVASIAGTLSVVSTAGRLQATEVGSDIASISGASGNSIAGTLLAVEANDTIVIAGQIKIQGTLVAAETGMDIAVIRANPAGPTGTFSATEASTKDTAAIVGTISSSIASLEWEILVTGYNSDPNLRILEVELYTQEGGADITTPSTPVTAIGSSFDSSPMAVVNDGASSNPWVHVHNGAQSWLRFGPFSSAQAIKGFSITSATDFGGAGAPKDFKLRAKVNGVYTDVITVTNITDWAANQKRVFNISGPVQPQEPQQPQPGSGYWANRYWTTLFIPEYRNPNFDTIDWSKGNPWVAFSISCDNSGNLTQTDWSGRGEGWGREIVRRAHAANRPAIVSFGGYFRSNPIYNALGGSVSRVTFMRNVVNYARNNGFDGVDLDMEEPFEPERAIFFGEYVRANAPELKVSFEVDGNIFDNHPPMGTLDQHRRMMATFDRVNLMSFVIGGGSDWETWHAAPLQGEAPLRPSSAKKAFQMYRDRGWPAEKINVGGMMGGLKFNGNTGPYQSWAVYSKSELTYWDAVAQGTRNWDDNAKVPWRNGIGNAYISYEDEQSFAAKCAWIKSVGGGGIIVWDAVSGPNSARAAMFDTMNL